MNRWLVALGLSTSILLISVGLLVLEEEPAPPPEAAARPGRERCDQATSDGSACLELGPGSSGPDLDHLRKALAGADTAEERDLLRLQAVGEQPVLARVLCEEMEGEQARQLCARIQGRAHLWIGGGGESGRTRRTSRTQDGE